MTSVLDFLGLNSTYLVECLVRRNLKLKYRRSSLGFLWSLFVPLLTSLTYLLLLKFIMRFSAPHYSSMLLLGVFTWSFFSVSSFDGMTTVFGNYTLASKVHISFNNFTLATTITAFINYLLSFPILVLYFLNDGLSITISYLALPLIMIMLFLFTYFFAIILSITTVYLRDLEHLFGVGLQLWMYATPILYPPSMIPADYSWLLYANPLAPIVVSLHRIVIEGMWPDPLMVSVGMLWLGLAFITAHYLFVRSRYTVLENV